MRRMRDANIAANKFLESKDITPTFICQGGAGTDWLWRIHHEEQFDCIILAIGSNELGRCTVERLQDRLNDYAFYLLSNRFTRHVVVMGLWPRKSQGFSVRARLFNSLSRKQMYWHSGVLFWDWSKKLTYRFADNVHLTGNSYRRALKYLISPIQYLFPYSSK